MNQDRRPNWLEARKYNLDLILPIEGLLVFSGIAFYFFAQHNVLGAVVAGALDVLSANWLRRSIKARRGRGGNPNFF